MIYFCAHVRALEEQIAWLRDRLAEAEKEKRESLEAARVREGSLLDRLLAKNNVAPVTEQPKPPRPEILTPFGVAEADIQDAFRESFLREETEHIMNRDSCDEGTARAYAEQEYVARYQVIR